MAHGGAVGSIRMPARSGLASGPTFDESDSLLVLVLSEMMAGRITRGEGGKQRIPGTTSTLLKKASAVL